MSTTKRKRSNFEYSPIWYAQYLVFNKRIFSFSCSPRKEKCQFSGDSIMEFIDNEMRESIRVLKKSKQCHLVPLEFDTNTFQILFTIPSFYRFHVRTVYWKRFGFFFAMDRYKPNIDVFNDICVPYFYIFSFKTVDIAKLTFFCNTRKSMMKTIHGVRQLF